MAQEKIRLDLTADEALVLFEWLARSDSEGSLTFAHPAEQRVLWSLEGQLESVLVEPLTEDYRLRLEEARKKIAGDV
jgi:hypothetical protein